MGTPARYLTSLVTVLGFFAASIVLSVALIVLLR